MTCVKCNNSNGLIELDEKYFCATCYEKKLNSFNRGLGWLVAHSRSECLEHYIKDKIITSLEVSEDKEKLVITVKDKLSLKSYVFTAWGDCCSKSWIESVINKENIINEKINYVTDLKLPEDYKFPESNEDNFEVYQVFGNSLISQKGHCDIILYNMSNGYYGGLLICESHMDE